MTYQRAATDIFNKNQVALAVTHGRFGYHIGVAFHSVHDGPKILHLSNHLKLRCDPYPPRSCWVIHPYPAPEKVLKQVVAIVRAVAKRNAQIRYGTDFRASRNSFDANGAYRPPKGSEGLTCASFVTEVFRAASIPLVDESTWQHSAANDEWVDGVCKMLAEERADQDHIDAVLASKNGLRLRPEEVAFSGTVQYLPKSKGMDYQTAQAGASSVVQALHAACPVQPIPVVNSLPSN